MKRLITVLLLCAGALCAQQDSFDARRFWGRPLSSTAPATGQAYVWNAVTGRWVPTAVGAGTIGGSGTANLIPKFTAGSTLGNSVFGDDGTAATVTQNGVVNVTFLASGALVNNLYVTAGKIGVNTASPAQVIDAFGQVIKLGGDVGQTIARTNSTGKTATLAAAHYTNAEEPFVLIAAYGTNSGASKVYVGGDAGGGNTQNAATDVYIYTAANNTTLTGTERMHINAAGAVSFSVGGSGTKIVCWKADGITLGYATMLAGDITACN